jgi:short-subunit dehydrogenase
MKRWLAVGAGLAAVAVSRRRKEVDVAQYFRNRACVVTGGGSGIGLEIVTQLMSLGARVLVVDFDAARLAAAGEAWPAIATLQLDLTEPDAPARLIAAATRELGDIQSIFNNAGVAVAGPFLENSDLHIQRMVDLNYTAHVRMTRHVLPVMIASGGGDINFTVSLSAWVSAPTLAVYSGTKGGLKNFIYALRREVAGKGIRLSGLHPNVVRTNLMPGHVFDKVPMKYGAREAAEAVVRGVAAGERDIFVNTEDRILQRIEQVAPAFIDWYLGRRPDAQALLAQSEALENTSR